MVDFLSTHGSEVSNMIFTEFNMEDALRVRGEEGYEDGLAEGKSLGLAEGKSIGLASEIRIIRKKLIKSMPACEIAELFELPENHISDIASLIQQHPQDTDVQIAERYLKEHSI